LIPRRPTRTLAQNAYWHGVIVESLRQFLAAQDYENCDHDFAHEILKEKFLRVPVYSPRTGAVMCYRTRSTADLDTAEFTDLIERARAWLADRFNVVVPDPVPWPEREKEKRQERAARAAVTNGSPGAGHS
jgi:hypothetical protein